MPVLVLVNGCGGAGKDTAGRGLLQAIESSALLDIKALSMTNPWDYQNFELGIQNAAALISSYAAAGFSHIILSGGVNSQARLDALLARLPSAIQVCCFWLEVPKSARDERRVARRRDEADKPQHLDAIDRVFTDPGTLRVPNGVWKRIPAESLSPGEVVSTILKELQLLQAG